MDRLTFKGHDGGLFVKEHDIKTCDVEDEILHTGNAIRKLAAYEDAEEQGLLLRLPTESYFIKDNKMYKGWVQEIVYSPCRKLLLDIRYDNNTLDSYRGYVGNTVFLTQAEAEQKLKEMDGDHGITE